ncbi:MAG: hypothetical protein ACREKS_06150 [Candidatus Rokuibacteriota bacterium]
MITVLADHREARSGVPERLRAMGALVMEESLDVADYVLSDRVGVAYARPLYVIEGRRLYGLRDVHPNFIRGAWPP